MAEEEKHGPEPQETAGVPRRAFLKAAGQTALGLAAGAGTAVEAAASTLGPVTIPAHLPSRLTIALWHWAWLAACSPGEPYHDLDRALAEHRERNLNTVRADVALGWAFDRQGRRRGPVEVLPWAPGVSDNLRGVNAKGGVRYDALERVLKMFELAKKHHVFVIPTSWQYPGGSTTHLDRALREDILATPLEQRFDHLADLHDRLIQELKKNGLEKQIAFVELHNEINVANVPGGLYAQKQDWLVQKPLVEKALRRLQQAHPDILFTADYVFSGPSDDPKFPGYQVLPENLQVADHHVYATGVQKALHDLTNTWEGHHVPPHPKDNALLRWLIGSEPRVSWEEFTKRAERVPRVTWPMEWFFANLEYPDRYDYWMFEHFGQYSAMMKERIQTRMREWGAFARQRGLPAVIDEGYIFYPPLNSRFEESAAGRLLFEFAVETAIEQGYWGVMLTANCAPDEPIWREHPQWISKTNERFLKSAR